MKKTAIYVDFDNVYSGILDKLGIPANPKKSKEVTPFQVIFLEEVIKEFFRKFKKKIHYLGHLGYYLEPEDHIPLCIKVFAEYDNLPLSTRFSPSMTVFLHNVGVIPVNPFVAYSKKKENRNAADVALTLSAIEDILIKEIPAEAVIICTHDIDLYPLILWLIEHTGKEILLASFPERTNRLYNSVLVGDRVNLNVYLRLAVEEASKNLAGGMGEITKKLSLTEKDLEFMEKIEDTFGSTYVSDLREKMEREILHSSEKIDKEICEKFKKKLFSGLKGWLRKEGFASTGLIIGSWLPKWNLGISDLQANECLKQIIQGKEFEEEGIYFEFEKEKDGLIYGKFYRTKEGE